MVQLGGIANAGAPFSPFAVPELQVVDYEASQQRLDPNAAPEKQAKVALDSAIASGNGEQLQVVLGQIEQHLPQHATTLMMHALRSAARCEDPSMMQTLLSQITSCHPQQLFELMKYALDGAAAQTNPAMMNFLLGTVQKVFGAGHLQLLALVQHAVNTTAGQGNLSVLKFLMDHTAASSIPIYYGAAFQQAACNGKAETLLKDAIKGGAQYENVIMMLLQCTKDLPEDNDSSVGSRQSMKNMAKLQLVKSYKKQDPALFADLMAAVKSYFPEECGRDSDVTM